MTTLYHQVWVSAPTVKLYGGIATVEGIGSWWDKPNAVSFDAGSILEFSPAQNTAC